MKIELDERKTRYFNENIGPATRTSLEEVINNIFRAYLEQIGSQTKKSYAAWLEEQLKLKDKKKE